ncbi:DUF4365 domain-containing protein [Microbacterium sp. P04]|uniref:DUF4365 domain-containing protein n=1 Tax=Microbacterium sp. P04 TaxID=3366947 RepID=UPI003746D8AE
MSEKLQDQNQLKGRWGELLAAFAFPAHWVVRPLPQDYGIDLQVEVFQPDLSDESGRRFRSTGGHFACQVKTTDAVSKGPNTVSFSAKTADLRLSELMGAASPLILLHVERPTRTIRYLCLTDYVEKILNVDQPGWRDQETITVYLPARNEIRLDDGARLDAHWQYFTGLALRAKLYAAANQFRYVAQRLQQAVEDFVRGAPYPPGEANELEHYSHEVDRAVREAISSVETASLVDLRASDSPFAGLFDNVALALAEIKKSYLPAMARLSRVLNADAKNETELKAAQGGFELAITEANVYFEVATAVGRIYEETHRLVALFAEPLEWDIVRTAPTAGVGVESSPH